MEEATPNSVGNKANDAGQRAQMATAGGYASKLGHATDEATREVKHNIDDLSRTASDVYHQASGYVTDRVDELRRQGKEVMKTAESTITHQPITAIAVALGVGVVFGLGFRSMFRK